jgi:glucose 1-dehydrogenase
MAENGRLQGKRAIVTGSDQGIGRAIALRFAHEGASVAINYRHNEAGANEVRAAIESAGGRAIVVGADVSTAAGAQQLIGAAIAAFGGLDVLVNNAGVEIQHPFLELSEQDWDTVIGVNLKGPFLCTSSPRARWWSRARVGGSSTSPPSTRICRCPATAPTAPRRADCEC